MKPGDIVRIKNDENDELAQVWLEDIEADLQADIADRDDYDQIYAAIEEGKPWTITAEADEELWQIKLNETGLAFPYLVPEHVLELIK